MTPEIEIILRLPPYITEAKQCWADSDYQRPSHLYENPSCTKAATTPIGLCDKHAAELLGQP